ncbi:MAG: ABC transporter permease subunit [Kiritimatiellaeota bacterium]|nr:ABC transporter permease subunit [Kiritimatiellota bacterium]
MWKIHVYGRALLGTARAAFLEAAQETSALLLALAGVTLTTLAPVLQFHQMGEAGRLARDAGFACALMFGLPLAVACASAAVHRELADGTAAVALAKPLPRGLFLCGKFLGVAGVCAVFWWGVAAALLLAERASERTVDTGEKIMDVRDARLSTLALLAPVAALGAAALLNYLRRARFGVAAFAGIPAALTLVLLACGFWSPQDAGAACGACDQGACAAHGFFTGWHWAWDAQIAWRCAPVALLLLFALWIYAAFATSLAARFGGGGTLGLSFALFALGLCADAVTRGGTAAWRRVFGALVPNAQHFWMADALARDGRLPAAYVPVAGVWTLGWCALFLMAGTALLNRRDVG